MSEFILRTNNLTKIIGKKKIIDNFSFDLYSNEIVGILGVNGAGKTTLMQILLGLIKATFGSIKIFDLEFEKNRLAILKRMNFSSSYIDLPGNLTVWQNLFIFAKLYEVKNPREKVDSLLHFFEMEAFKDTLTGNLSSGESARVNLCKALVNNPELLLLDEPTASLDPNIAKKVRQMIQQAQRKKRMSILYTSHNMKDIEALCNRVIFLDKGKFFMEGTSKAIKQQLKQDSLENVFIHLARDNNIQGS